jgi:ribonuclease-3
VTPAELARLERFIGYVFDDKTLLTQALTHRSFSSMNNERLEFLGDGILNFIVADNLYKKFPQAAEGQLSRLRASLVKQKTLADIARELKLSEFLVMGTGELKSGGFNRNSILSDAVEAIVGAVYLEAGFQTTAELLAVWFESRFAALSLDQAEKDAKSQLQEWLQAQKLPLPEYELLSVEGESHDQTFSVRLKLSVLENSIETTGTSRRGAEQSAAAEALAGIAQLEDDQS